MKYVYIYIKLQIQVGIKTSTTIHITQRSSHVLQYFYSKIQNYKNLSKSYLYATTLSSLGLLCLERHINKPLGKLLKFSD